jgi:nucleoside-diphosphate-sugar epimerase
VNILILGAGGFIGSHMVEHLVARGEHEVTALDVTDEKLAHIDSRGYAFIAADIRRDGAVVDALIARNDVVVDLIAYANPSMYVTSPLEVFELNFLQNLEIAKRCSRHGKRLIQYSSAEVYGKAACSVRSTASGGSMPRASCCSSACCTPWEPRVSSITRSCGRSTSSVRGSTTWSGRTRPEVRASSRISCRPC